MQIELNEKEANLILGLLNAPVQIAPSSMPDYINMINGISEKLKLKAKE